MNKCGQNTHTRQNEKRRGEAAGTGRGPFQLYIGSPSRAGLHPVAGRARALPSLEGEPGQARATTATVYLGEGKTNGSSGAQHEEKLLLLVLLLLLLVLLLLLMLVHPRYTSVGQGGVSCQFHVESGPGGGRPLLLRDTTLVG